MITEAIIIAVLSWVGTLAGSYFSNRKASALIAYRIEQLESKVNRHNNLIERTYNLEQRAAVWDEQIKVTNYRIDDANNRLDELEKVS